MTTGVENGDEQAFTKLPANREIGKIGNAHALFGHEDNWLDRARDSRPGQFTLDVGMLWSQRPSLELSAGGQLVMQTGVSLEFVGWLRNTPGRQIGRRRHEASPISAQ